MNFFPFIHKKKKEKAPIQLPLFVEEPIPENKPKEEKEEERKIEIELF
jgi:hypothetical protein